MVQRTRGELPAVEPLVAPQWTVLGAQAASSEGTFEREAPVRMDLQRREVTPFSKPEATAKIPALNQNAPAPPDVSGRNPSIEPSPKASEPAHHAQIRSTPQNLSTPKSPAVAQAPQDSAPPELRVLEVRTVNAPGAASDVQRKAADEPQRALPPMGRKPEHEVKPVPAIVQVHNEAAPGMDAAGEHTEIHITIGSVELHAPRTAAKAPPFQPRVTLDQFLNRRSGAAS
jgi:hypothetical protein